MEESQYLIWMKRKQILKSHLQAPIGACNNSWEERAFAEDAARILGGCIWPPRSYSCSFCKREFRSAQALGGHMNVHRRDRARLKQSLSPHREGLLHLNNDCKSLGAQINSAEICSLQQDCWVNPHSSPAGTITTSSLSPTLSAISTQENCAQHTIPHASSVSWGIQQKGSSNSEPEEAINNARKEDFKDFSRNNYVETGLSMGFNSMLGQTLPTGGSCGDEAISCKRHKTSISSLPVFVKPCSSDRRLAFQSAEIILGLKPGIEDLDLELRLGKPQKVK